MKIYNTYLKVLFFTNSEHQLQPVDWKKTQQKEKTNNGDASDNTELDASGRDVGDGLLDAISVLFMKSTLIRSRPLQVTYNLYDAHLCDTLIYMTIMIQWLLIIIFWVLIKWELTIFNSFG
jgi:hypothetical protein